MKNQKEKKEFKKVLFGGFEAGESIAKELIAKHHDELAEARFKFVCRNYAAKSGGTLVPGNIYKVSGKFEYLLDCDFLVEVALEVWNDLNNHQRIALIDHFLTRCVCEVDEKTEDRKYKLRKPPVQEFPEVAERNGQWNDSLIEMAKVLHD
jgi:hypothetical protein